MMATGTQEIPQSAQADPDDALLVKRFQRGEESAFNHIGYPLPNHDLSIGPTIRYKA